MKIGIPLGCEHDHIDNLFSAFRQYRSGIRSLEHTQKMAPTAAVSMAVLINLSMIVSVSGETNSPNVSDACGSNRIEEHALLKPVLLRRKKKNKVALKGDMAGLEQAVRCPTTASIRT